MADTRHKPDEDNGERRKALPVPVPKRPARDLNAITRLRAAVGRQER